jgi:hypothetical protein
MRAEIIESMARSNEIKLLGTTHRSFFKNDIELGKAFEDFCKSDKRAKVLIVNPLSPCIIKRTVLEEPEDFAKKFRDDPLHYRTSDTFEDIENVLNAYIKDFHECENIEIRFYKDFPSMWLIITEDRIYFQPYQYGANRKDPKLASVIGESFIVMVFGRGRGDVYNLLSKHYDVVWNDINNLSYKEMHATIKDDREVYRQLVGPAKDDYSYWNRCNM